MRKEQEVLEELQNWAEDNDQVRGMILTSTRPKRVIHAQFGEQYG